MANVIIELGNPLNTQVMTMMAKSDAYYASLYPQESNHLLNDTALSKDNVYFFTAAIGEAILGFGAIVVFENYAEIKRMYVSPVSRGMGIGKKLLAALEKQSLKLGINILKLETGIKQPEAIHLYKTAGYQEIEPFGDYKPDILSVFMLKSTV